VEHGHCPDGCEHPQPFRASLHVDDVWDLPTVFAEVEYEFCGRCWHRFGELVALVPCTSEIC
jgi:hypothetical protein